MNFDGRTADIYSEGMPKQSITGEKFTGIPEAGLRFLRQLKLHNDREWFQPRKEEYFATVEEPMKALVFEVAEGCRAQGIPLHAKERSPVMRVYRDIRFSKDKTPYKTHVSAELRRSFSDSQGMLYIHISPEEAFVAAGVYQPERPLLSAWREAIIKNPEHFLKMQSALERKRLPLSRNYTLTKLPRGFEDHADEPIADALKMTSFVVSRPLTKEECLKPDLAKKIVQFAADSQPLMQFAWEIETTYAKIQRKKLRAEELI
jgi:uncharacterized protein (TIGR02453 family)